MIILMLKLKFQYFGHLMRRADSLEKTLMLGKIEDRGVRYAVVHGVTKSTGLPCPSPAPRACSDSCPSSR